MVAHRKQLSPLPAPSTEPSGSVSSLCKASLTQRREECGQRRTDFLQAEQTWLWRQGGSLCTGNKGDVRTHGICGTWAAVRGSTKSLELRNPLKTLPGSWGISKTIIITQKTLQMSFHLVLLPIPSLCWLSSVTESAAQPWTRSREGAGCCRCACMDHLLLTRGSTAFLWFWLPLMTEEEGGLRSN